MPQLTVHAIPTHRLDAIRSDGVDDLGNPLANWPAQGWEPLRCCLRIAGPGESLALISYTPFESRSVWSEAGPVFIHRHACAGYSDTAELPPDLRTGPRVLRTYAPDGSLDYDDITLVPEGTDLEPALVDLLARPGVARVHVRAHLSQCFAYEVTARGE